MPFEGPSPLVENRIIPIYWWLHRKSTGKRTFPKISKLSTSKNSLIRIQNLPLSCLAHILQQYLPFTLDGGVILPQQPLISPVQWLHSASALIHKLSLNSTEITLISWRPFGRSSLKSEGLSVQLQTRSINLDREVKQQLGVLSLPTSEWLLSAA